MSEYVPTIPEVDGIRDGWACAHVREDITPEAAYAAFDRWLAETIREAKAEAWDEGYDRALRSHCDALDLDGRCDVEDPNPYAEEATNDHA